MRGSVRPAGAMMKINRLGDGERSNSDYSRIHSGGPPRGIVGPRTPLALRAVRTSQELTWWSRRRRLPAPQKLLAQLILAGTFLPGRLWPRVQLPTLLGTEAFLI